MSKSRSNQTTRGGARGVSVVDRVNVFFHFRRYIKMITRRWFLLVASVVLVGGFSIYRALNTPDIYRAYSRIGVAPKYQTQNRDAAILTHDLITFYERQLQLLGSTDVLGRVRERLKELSIAKGDVRASANASRGKAGFVLTVESTDFEYARRFAEAWAEEFLKHDRQDKEDMLAQEAAGAREKVLRYQKTVEERRDDLHSFQREHGIVSVQQISEVPKNRLSKLQEDYLAKKTLRERLESWSKEELALQVSAQPALADGNSSASRTGADAAVDPLEKYRSKYPTLEKERRLKESEYERLMETLKPAHPYMLKLAEEMRLDEEQIKVELEQLNLRQLAEIESLKREEAIYQESIRKSEQEIYNPHQLLVDLNHRQNLLDEAVRQLDSAQQELQAYETSSAADGFEFTIDESGVGSSAPVGPDRKRMITSGLLVGLVIGLVLVYFLDRLDDRLDLAEEIQEALNIPILGQVPQVKRSEGAGAGQPLLMTKLERHSMFAEAVRGVRSAVILSAHGKRQEVFLITSAAPEDGKTTFTTNFAITLAMAGNKTLLLDADLRRGNIHKFFESERQPGLSEILRGHMHWTDAMHDPGVKHLQTIPCGSLVANPGELLLGPILADLMKEARAEFDYIVIDCPPVTGVDDTFSLAHAADSVLFVVRAGETSMRFARNALNVLNQRKAPVKGIVLNGITADNPYYYYQYYYHSYYNKGEKLAALNGGPAAKMPPPRRMQTQPGSMQAEADKLARAKHDSEST